MKYIYLVIMLLFCGSAFAQDKIDSLQKPRVFVASGMGFGFPLGDLKSTLFPKYSSSLGITIPFKNERAFIYPMIDFLSLGYNQDIAEEDYPYTLKKGTAKIYNLSVTSGINRFFGDANIYAFLGPSLQLVREPRITVDVSTQNAKIEKMMYITPGVKAGLGAHYQIGSFNLFAETSWVHNFHEIQGKSVNIVTVYGGLKTNITGLANKVIAFF